jgi:hypothetical protein
MTIRTPIQGLLLALILSGCSGKSVKKSPVPCVEFGQRCEFAPGKLGTCVVREQCSGKDCFHCQSQH